jgi:hypothetical protein
MAWPRWLTSSWREGDRLAGRHPDLQLDQIDAGHHFRDRVLHLQASVHLQEIEIALAIDQKLQRAGVDVATARTAATAAPPCAGAVGVQQRRGRLLDDLLVAALDRALALEEVHGVAVAGRRRPGTRCGAGCSISFSR